MNSIDLPEAGGAVTLAFNLDAMEKLYEQYQEDYVNETLRRLNLRDPKCLRLCVEAMAVEPIELAEILKTRPVDDLVMEIATAINMSLTGKPLDA